MPAAATIAGLAERIAGKGKLVAGPTQGEVLWQIAQRAGVASRGEIAEKSGLSTATVSKAVATLIEAGLVAVEGKPRPGAPLRWTDRYAAAGVVIASRDDHPVEFVGTVTMLDGTPLPIFSNGMKRTKISRQARTESNPKRLLDELGEFIKALLADAASDAPETQVLGCGISVGGHVDGDRGSIWKSFNTGWKDNLHLGADLASWLKEGGRPLDVVVENDVTSLAVLKNLRTRPADSYVLVVIYQDGVGGAVVVNGRTWRGAHGLPGEIGHVYVGNPDKSEEVLEGHGEESQRKRESPLDRAKDEEPRCRCGKVSCVEAWATPLAILRKVYPERANELALGGDVFDDAFYQLASRPATDEGISDIFHAAGTALARGLAAGILWLDPDRIFLYLPPD